MNMDKSFLPTIVLALLASMKMLGCVEAIKGADNGTIVIGVIIILIVWAAVRAIISYEKRERQNDEVLRTGTPEEVKQFWEKEKSKITVYKPQRGPLTSQHGPLNAEIICPHCQTKGAVHVKQVKLKQGISGGKATAAVLTGGVSLLATGLSRKQNATEAYCANCHSTWHF